MSDADWRERPMFVVIFEFEGAILTAFGTHDRETAHRVLKLGEQEDAETAARENADRGRFTLIDCADEHEFLARVRGAA